MIVIGLTGGIATGKSTVAKQFARLGATLYNADSAVHRLLAGPAARQVEAAFPGVLEKGRVHRGKLAEKVFGNAEALATLERILHPLVRREEEKFIRRARQRRLRLLVLEIPLLFETAGEERCDSVVVTVAPPFLQRQRALARPRMDEDKLRRILARQLPQHVKMRRAHFVIPTGLGLAYSYRQVAGIMARLKRRCRQGEEKNERNRPRHRNHRARSQ